MLHAALIKGNFQDSVTLMVLSRDLSATAGVKRVSIMMGTPANKTVYRETGLWHDLLTEATPNDLCIVVDSDVEDPSLAAMVSEQVSEHLAKLASGRRKAGYPVVRSWRRAREVLPEANLTLISVAGQYASGLARQAIEDGSHVMIFSDNVSLEQEVELKKLAQQRGLLVMGPDCGTAILGKTPLAFANRVPAGPIAIVGASGTGIQELTTQIAAHGSGISHALGLGGRDLSESVGGVSAAMALDWVARDAATRVVVFVSKPPSPAVRQRVFEQMRGLGKPVVALFLGDRPARRDFGNVHLVRTLDEAAILAVELAALDSQIAALPDVVGRGICGLYTGGTLASEAADLLAESLELTGDTEHLAGCMLRAGNHRIIDLGDDIYTRGRPHPMIDPFQRNEMIKELARDSSIGVLLLDVVLGFGSHADPAGEVARAVKEMRAARGTAPIQVIATLTGTAEDPQGREMQAATLEEAGVVIASSVRAAVLLAIQATTASPDPRSDVPGLLAAEPAIINIGLRSFADELHANGAKVAHLQWEPSPEGSERLKRLAALLQ